MRGLRSVLTVSAGCRLMRHRAIILLRLRCSRWSACGIRCAKLRLSMKIGQVVEPSGTGGSEQSKPLTVVKNVAAVGFGIVGTVILLFTLLLCAMELIRAFLLWNAERKRRRMSIEERVRQSQKLMFKLISLWGIDAALGWETAATDKALADTLPSVKPGEYERVNGLLEKTIYGGIALEPFEERALDLFVQRLWGRNVKKSWKMRLKLRYACLLAAK